MGEVPDFHWRTVLFVEFLLKIPIFSFDPPMAHRVHQPWLSYVTVNSGGTRIFKVGGANEGQKKMLGGQNVLYAARK